MDAKDLVEAAKTQVVKEATKETVEAYIVRMCAEAPDKIVEPGELPETTIIPGYEVLNLGLAQIYELKWGMLKELMELKAYFQAHLVKPPSLPPHIIRGFNRLDWGELQKRIISETKDRLQAHMTNNSDPKWADAEVEMHTEEMIVCAGCVAPPYDKQTVRKLPTGAVSFLAKAILQSCGYDQQTMPPLPLK